MKKIVAIIVAAIIGIILLVLGIIYFKSPRENEAVITDFVVKHHVSDKKADISNFRRSVRIDVDPDTDITQILPTYIGLSDSAAKINPPAGKLVNFEKGTQKLKWRNRGNANAYTLPFDVTSRDGVLRTWKVTIFREPNDQADLLSVGFNIMRNGTAVPVKIVNESRNDSVYTVTVPDGTDRSALIMTGEISPYAKAPILEARKPMSFNIPQKIEVIAENGTKKVWIVDVVIASPAVQPAAEVEKPSGTGTSAQAQEKTANADDRIIELAAIRSGNGYEHSFIRQIMFNPAAFGCASDDPKEIRKFAGWKAHEVALANGYVENGTGREIRVAKIGVVPFLNADGSVTEYPSIDAAKSGNESDFTESGSEFDGDQHLQKDYEYIYTPSAKPVASSQIPAIYNMNGNGNLQEVSPKVGGKEQVFDLDTPDQSSSPSPSIDSQTQNQIQDSDDDGLTLDTIPAVPKFSNF